MKTTAGTYWLLSVIAALGVVAVAADAVYTAQRKRADTVPLDVSASEAKIARARVHFEALKTESAAVIQQHNPYTLRISDVDQQTGWCSLFMTLHNLTEHGLGVVVGDVIHNLRCAVDYIVTTLVDDSGATLRNKHQFPIYVDQTAYEKAVGNATSALKDGPLRDVTRGLREIWEVQPFNRKPQPEADPLFVVQRFSNADKHRVIAAFMPFLGGITGKFDIGEVVEQQQVPPPADLETNREYEVERFRFAAPYPPKVTFNADVSVRVHFGTPAFGQHLVGHAVSIEMLKATCDHVAMVTNLFKALPILVAGHLAAFACLWEACNCEQFQVFV